MLVETGVAGVGSGVVVGFYVGTGVCVGTGFSVGTGVCVGAGLSVGTGVCVGTGLSVGFVPPPSLTTIVQLILCVLSNFDVAFIVAVPLLFALTNPSIITGKITIKVSSPLQYHYRTPTKSLQKQDSPFEKCFHSFCSRQESFYNEYGPILFPRQTEIYLCFTIFNSFLT